MGFVFGLTLIRGVVFEGLGRVVLVLTIGFPFCSIFLSSGFGYLRLPIIYVGYLFLAAG